jgi:hypothetical protein
MADKWYYVENGERQGPVDVDEIIGLYQSGALQAKDYVWVKGFENWTKIEDVPEIANALAAADPPPEIPSMPDIPEELDLRQLDQQEKCLFIKVGVDRGDDSKEYGPYSLSMIKRLFDENRINGQTYIFKPNTQGWIALGEVSGYQDIFNDIPPVITDEEQRTSKRKPFIARMFIATNNRVFEGVCRDISTGGMQVLISDFPGSPGDNISFNVHPENSQFHFVASGEIVRMLDGGQGFSFQFTNLDPEAKKVIENYVNE